MDRLVRSEVANSFKSKTIQNRMSVNEAIYKRRSIRNYTYQMVSDHTIHQLLAAAAHAPSEMNLQPWAFAVIQNPEWLKYISDHSEAKNLMGDSEFDIFYGTTTLIVIYGKKDGFSPVGDCNLAAENLMLAACGMGLGTCPIGFARDFLQTKEMLEELEIPSDYQVVLPIVVGYPAEHPQAVKRNPPRIFNWVA